MLVTMICARRSGLLQIAVAVLLAAPTVWADNHTKVGDADDSVSGPIPDIRDADLKLKPQKRNWVIVPVPVSNPTLDTGLVVGGAYFYPQTKAQKKVQPASVTGAAGFRSSNQSSAFGIAHQSYFSEDKWRIGGIVGHADVKLDLSTPGAGAGPSVDWLVKGDFFAAGISRKIAGKWYAC